MKQKERLGCGKHQFPNRDRHKASPLASPQQPVDHVFLRGLTPPKSCRPLLSHADHNANRFYGHRRTTEPREFFLEEMPELVQFHHNHALARLWLRARRVRWSVGGGGGCGVPRGGGVSISELRGSKRRVAWRWHSSTGPACITAQR